MNIKTLYDQARSKLSNHDPQIPDVPANQSSTPENDAISIDHNRIGSVSDVIENAESSDDVTKASNEITAVGAAAVAVAGSTYSMFKGLLNKSVVTVKDTTANMSIPDSVTGAAKNILDKSMDVIKQTKSAISSEDTLADKAKNRVSRNTIDQHESSSETTDATLQGDQQFTGNTVETDGVDTPSTIDIDNAQTIIDLGDEAVSELKGDINQATAVVTDEIEMPMLATTFAENANKGVKTAKDHVSMVNHTQLNDAIGDTVNQVAESANEMLTAATADSDVTDSVSVSEQAGIDTTASTVGVAIASTLKTLDHSVDDSPDNIDVDSSATWVAKDNSEFDSDANQTDDDANKDIDNVTPGSGPYDDERIGAIASTESSGARWIMPLILLALVGAGIWWLTTLQSKQPSEAMTASLNETVNTDQSQNSIVVPKTDVDVSPVNKRSLTPEATNAASDIKSVKNDLSATANGNNGTKTGSVQTGIDTYGNNKTAESNTVRSVSAAQTIDPARVVADKNNLTNIKQTLPSGSPVDAITRFLETGDTTSGSMGFILYGLSYKIDSSDISENSTNSTKIIADLASVLNTYTNIKIRLEGHTDSRGDDDANLELSAARANTIKTHLVDLNIDPARITTLGLGETDPIMDNETEAWQSKNRRVEVIIEQ